MTEKNRVFEVIDTCNRNDLMRNKTFITFPLL